MKSVKRIDNKTKNKWSYLFFRNNKNFEYYFMQSSLHIITIESDSLPSVISVRWFSNIIIYRSILSDNFRLSERLLFFITFPAHPLPNNRSSFPFHPELISLLFLLIELIVEVKEVAALWIGVLLLLAESFHAWLLYFLLIVGELIANKDSAESESCLRKVFLALTVPFSFLELSFVNWPLRP